MPPGRCPRGRGSAPPASSCPFRDRGGMPCETLEHALPVPVLLLDGGHGFGVEGLVDHHARARLPEIDANMAAILHAPVDPPHRLDPRVGGGEVEACLAMPRFDAEPEQATDPEVVRRPGGAPVIGGVPLRDLGGLVEGTPDHVQRRIDEHLRPDPHGLGPVRLGGHPGWSVGPAEATGGAGTFAPGKATGAGGTAPDVAALSSPAWSRYGKPRTSTRRSTGRACRTPATRPHRSCRTRRSPPCGNRPAATAHPCRSRSSGRT